jgi:hypothetical protein
MTLTSRELKSIDPPRTIQEAMEQQMRETLPEVAAGDANKLLLLPTGAALREGGAAPRPPEPGRTPPSEGS